MKCVISDVNPDLAFFTETRLRDSISEKHLHIPWLHCKEPFYRPPRWSRLVYQNNINFKSLNCLHDAEIETMWTWLQPTRLPRGITCLIAGTVYHTQTVNDMAILSHSATSLASIGGQFPGCGILEVTGRPWAKQPCLSLFCTSLYKSYHRLVCLIITFVILNSKARTTRLRPSRKQISRLDTRKKLELALSTGRLWIWPITMKKSCSYSRTSS